MDKKTTKLLNDLKHAKTIARSEVSKKWKYGSSNQEIYALFFYMTSAEDNGAHCFGSRKMAKKYPTKKIHPVFFITLPKSGEPEYFEMINKLTKINLSHADFYMPKPNAKPE
jgi:hypothetical protein